MTSSPLPGEPAGLAAPPTAPGAPRRRVLFVDDDALMRGFVTDILTPEFDVDTAGDGEQALISVLRRRPDLIVTDIVMPTLDGVEFVRLLRETPGTATIPVLLTSGRAAEEVRIEGFQVGADSFLAKPYSARELCARVRALLQSSRRHNDEARQEALGRTTVERAALLESITDGFFAIDDQWRFSYLNQRALDYFQRGRDELLGRSLWDVLRREVDPVFGHAFEHAMNDRMPVSFEAFSNETTRWLEVHAFPGASGLAVNFRDITDRKHAESVLRDSELHIRTIADAVPVLMWRSDIQRRATWFNKTWLAFTHRSLDAELRVVWGEGIHPEDLEDTLRQYDEAFAERAPIESEFRMRRHDGMYRWMLNRGNPVFDGPGGAFSGYIGTCIDITELKHNTVALLAAEQRYRAFVANSSEAIWRYELDVPLDLSLPLDEQVDYVLEHGRLAELNDAMARMYGFENAQEMVGMPLAQTLPPDDAVAREYLRELAAVRFSREDVESREIDRDGNLRYFANSITPVIENNRLLRAWGTQRDITDRRRAEERTKEGERRKDEFVATLAHELRNPLAPIRTGIHILKRRGGERPDPTVLDMMDRQMTHMVRLLDDLLDLSRISLGRLELQRTPVPLGDALAAAVESATSAIEAKRHHIEVRAEETPLVVDGDSARLAQVFANLISNSAKYTDPGGHIVVCAARDGDHASITVSDDGIGIPPDSVERVFEMFSQVRAHQQRQDSGLGIGLSVVRTLVHMHGGTVTAASAGPGKGSTFTVRLPLIDTNRDCAPERDATPASSKALRILVVDDNVDAAESLAMMLAGDGHTVRAVNGGEEAVETAADFAPELVFMDLGMPGCDGLEATRRIRAANNPVRPWIVALTGWGQQSDRDRSAAAGADRHLVKPIGPEGLQAAISEAAGDA